MPRITVKMITLKAVRSIFRLMGFQREETLADYLLTRFLKFWHLFFLQCVMIPSAIFCISHLNDMSKATLSFYCVAATALATSHQLYFMYRSKDIFETLDKLQILVDKRDSDRIIFPRKSNRASFFSSHVQAEIANVSANMSEQKGSIQHIRSGISIR